MEYQKKTLNLQIVDGKGTGGNGSRITDKFPEKKNMPLLLAQP